MLPELPRILTQKTGRCASWDRSGRNRDWVDIAPGQTAVLADISGPAQITHIWMTQWSGYRECLLKITYDDASFPSVLVPLGDFFCLGHGLVNSFQSTLFTASTNYNVLGARGCALNANVPMPFAKRAVVELVNEGSEPHNQYFYIDYETLPAWDADNAYLHAEFRRANPFQGWGPEIQVNTPLADVANLERQAWDNNYVILETAGRGHYIGCNLSVTNFTRNWWGEGDDMIWVDGYHWPPDLHGTGSEDYLGQCGGMHPSAYLNCGSSIFEGFTVPHPAMLLYRGESGQQTGYVFHIDNPVRFEREIKVTIEVGHANHLANEVSSTAYWYAGQPTAIAAPPPVTQRLPVRRDNSGEWLRDPERECPSKPVTLMDEMRVAKARRAQEK